MRGDWGQRKDSGVCDGLGPLAGTTVFNVSADKVGQARPSKFYNNQPVSF